jgi:hypothetical protein
MEPEREVVAMDKYDLNLRLSGTSSPSGEITLEALSKIAGGLQELATRITRYVIGQYGPGRTPDTAAKISTLRLRGISTGSTQLAVGFGEPNTLDFDTSLETEVAGRYWEIIDGIGTSVRPHWATDLIAESALHLCDALRETAQTVEVSRNDGRVAKWASTVVSRSPWQSAAAIGEQAITVSGILEKVDLYDRRFRIRDDVGNTVALNEVQDADHVGRLVGQRTVATGLPVTSTGSRTLGLSGVSIAAAPTPPDWVPGEYADIEAIFAAAPGPDPAGVKSLTDDDLDPFVAALNE